MIHSVFTTEGFFEVSIECWCDWDLNPRPLNSAQTLSPTYICLSNNDICLSNIFPVETGPLNYILFPGLGFVIISTRVKNKEKYLKVLEKGSKQSQNVSRNGNLINNETIKHAKILGWKCR